MNKELTCIICPNSCKLSIEFIDGKWNVTNARCPRGIPFAVQEMTNPLRTLSSTVKTTIPNFPLLPVKTSDAVPQSMLLSIMKILNSIEVSDSVHVGDVIIKNVMNTGVDILATCNLDNPYGGEHREAEEPADTNI